MWNIISFKPTQRWWHDIFVFWIYCMKTSKETIAWIIPPFPNQLPRMLFRFPPKPLLNGMRVCVPFYPRFIELPNWSGTYLETRNAFTTFIFFFRYIFQSVSTCDDGFTDILRRFIAAIQSTLSVQILIWCCKTKNARVCCNCRSFCSFREHFKCLPGGSLKQLRKLQEAIICKEKHWNNKIFFD